MADAGKDAKDSAGVATASAVSAAMPGTGQPRQNGDAIPDLALLNISGAAGSSAANSDGAASSSASPSPSPVPPAIVVSRTDSSTSGTQPSPSEPPTQSAMAARPASSRPKPPPFTRPVLPPSGSLPATGPPLPRMAPPVPRGPPAGSGGTAPGLKRNKMPMSLSSLGAGASMANAFRDFSRYVDPSGKLQFSGKAIIHADGVDFSGGNSYRINMSELVLLEELGKGQYGTVHKVRHEPTGVIMAMKEIRLELDQAKLNAILMELDVLHKSTSKYIVEFYGAFFVESCVYYCMEFMDYGSLDRLEMPSGLPEPVLAKTALAMVHGLRFLKDDLSIIHRDIKPTNVLANSKGEVKLCDFGVSGQLTNSLAKTNIGCQPYMAPERITFEQAATYTVASDVWSLGIALVEMGSGKYPYPTEASVFAQLTAIVSGEAPSLPPEEYSEDCRDFISQCLHKDPKSRPTYGELALHPWLRRFETEEVDMQHFLSDAFARFTERTEKARAEQQAKEQAALLLKRSGTEGATDTGSMSGGLSRTSTR